MTTQRIAPPRGKSGAGQGVSGQARRTEDRAAEVRGQGGSRITAETVSAVKEALPAYLATLGEVRHQGRRTLLRCPLPGHDDSHPSFASFSTRSGTQYGACSCGWRGDSIKLAMELHGLCFPDAVRHVAEAVGISVGTETGTPSRKPQKPVRSDPRMPEAPTLPAEFEIDCRAARARLWRSDHLCQKAGMMLGARPETIRELCYTSDALGWDNGRLLYLYEHGVKQRNPEGSRIRFQWIHGRAVHPWRWHFAARPEVREIYLCESESDAVAMIDAGMEELHPKTGPASAVIACPGASNFPEAWGRLFKGKRVTLCFDKDQAGDNGARKIAKILSRHASRVVIA